ncbi:putative branched-chain-amino-acid aminotransferase [Paracoccus haematequi]|uniref:Probable branched-chain-amino-acid aminotransferase n=2 Tax=Paracoccus haematequi TaxID=2491866 RepID=A0A3S4DBQ2_9RHOB|nr:putative branched-chain-amino-acid aminotransferase [Paracoccus haematequi]
MQGRISEPLPAGLTVIETMRAEPDGRVQLWPLHLDRLRRDCAAVGFPLDEGRVSAVLAGLPRGQVLRARLTVDAAGAVALTHQPLAANPPLWLLRIADVRLSSSDPWLRIKTSHRPGYDAARAALPGAVDEALLLNERGEICEGTITTLFLEREGRLLTPALDCGLLPGVLRASLLASGRAREAVLRPDDLEDGRILMGNALRGLIPARLS